MEGKEGHEEGWASGRYPVTLLLIRAVPERSQREECPTLKNHPFGGNLSASFRGSL